MAFAVEPLRGNRMPGKRRFPVLRPLACMLAGLWGTQAYATCSVTDASTLINCINGGDHDIQLQADVNGAGVLPPLAAGVVITTNGKNIFNSVISGAGGLTENSSTQSLFLVTNNTYSGPTVISAGNVQVGAGGTVGSLGTGAVIDNAAISFVRSDNITVANNISGSGTLTQVGGTLTLTGNNSYGGTFIFQGTIQVGDGTAHGSLGTGNVFGSSGTVLSFNRPDTVVVANNIDTGANNVANELTLVQAGSGTLILTSNNNRYLGPTFVNAGTLQIGNGGSTGSMGLFGVNLATNTRLVFDLSGTSPFNNNIAGNGSVIQSGSGNVILTGSGSSYSGGTTINSGVLTINNGNALGTGDITLAGGRLQTTNDPRFQTSNVVTLANGITFAAGQTSTIAAATGTTLNLNPNGLAIDSGANAKFGSAGNAGTIVLAPTGSLSAAPNATIEVVAGTLRDGNGGFGTNANIVSAFTVDANATYDMNNFSTTFRNLQGAGTVSTGNNSLGNITVNGGNFTGTIQGGGNLIEGGTGTFTVSNINLAGSTIINSGGTLQVGSGGAASISTSSITDNGALVFNSNGTVNVAAAIGGGGTLTQSGSGTTTLSGNNSYSGGTTISNGTLAVASNTALGTGVVNLSGGELLGTANLNLASGKLTFTGGTTSTLAAATGTTLNYSPAGLDLGSAAVARFGRAGEAGTIVLSAAGGGSNVSGDATMEVVAGTLRAGDGRLGTITASAASLTVDGGASLELADFNAGAKLLQGDGTINTGIQSTTTLTAGTGNFNGRITGGGQLVKSGSGTLTLTGNSNDYGGGTTINAGGTLQIGNNTANGSLGGGNVLDNGNLTFKRNDTVTLNNSLSGSGSLTQAGTGTLIVNGNNSYGGGTTINSGGTLQLGDTSGNSALGTGSVTNNGTLSVDIGGALAIANDINGSGSLVKTGSGILNLSGNSSYSGGTIINGGTVAINNVSATGTGSVTLNGGALSFLNSMGNYGVTGGISVADGQTGTVAAAAGATARLFTAMNVGAGSTLKIGNATDTGTVSWSVDVVGGTVAGDARMEIAGGTFNAADFQIGGFLSGFERFTIDTGATMRISQLARVKNLQGGGTVDMLGGPLEVYDGSFSGVLQGAGGLSKYLSPNTLVLTGNNNTYSGDTHIYQGTLQIGDGNANGSLGTGAVVIDTDGTLAFNRPDVYVVNNAISGTGNLNVTGGGTIAYTGVDTRTAGVTTIFSGNTLQVGNGAGSTGDLGGASITNNGNLTFNRDGASTLAADMNGSGNLNVSGGITLTYTGADTRSGGTTNISSGSTLQVGNGGTGGSLSNAAITDDGALTFNRTGSINLGANMSGAGSLNLTGGVTLTYTGADTRSGATSIAAGSTLQVGDGTSGSLGSGAVTDNGTLIFNLAGSPTVGNVFSGTGTLRQTSGRNLILTGNSAGFTGTTEVASGTLSVNGNLGNSNFTVVNGGILGGTGTVGSTTIQSGGVLAPGNSIGTITVNGPLTFNAGSIYRVETDATGNADKTVVNGALTINGGTVDVQAGTGNYQRNTSYTIITNTGAQTGTFTGVTSNLAFLTPTLSYTPSSVLLNLQSSNVLSYNTVAITPNQTSTANYLNAFANAPGNPGAAALIRQLDNLSAAQARTAFDSMSGSQHISATQTGLALFRGFNDALFAHSNSAGEGAGFTGVGALKGSSIGFSSPVTPWGTSGDMPYQLSGMAATSSSSASTLSMPAPRETGAAASGDPLVGSSRWGANPAGQNGLWGQALGTGGRIAGDGNGAGSSYRAGGFMLGYDHAVSTQWLLGAAAGYHRANWDASTNGTAPANGKVETPEGAVYARYTAGPWMLALSGSYADHKFDTSRTVTIGAANSTATSTHHGNEWGFSVQGEYALAAGIWQIRPLAGLRYTRLREDSFTESGAGAANLSVDARTTASTALSGGVRVLRQFDPANAGAGGVELRAVASHTFGDVDSPLNSRLAGQAASFTVNGTPLKRDALTFGAGASRKLGGNFSGYVDTSYETRGSGQNAYAIGAGVRWVW